jgi:HEAT repeat protein
MKIKFKQDKKTILKLLETTNIKRRIKILEKMNGINERDCINILLKVLEDPSWTMRENAAYKLAEYGKRVVPRLERLLNRGYWFTRAAACISLGEIGSIKVLASLIELIKTDANPTVKKEASKALLKIAKKEPLRFLEALKKLMLDDQSFSSILQILQDHDPDLHKFIMEEIENV